jgi:hypothetical protein
MQPPAAPVVLAKVSEREQRQQLQARFDALKMERSSWLTRWREIAEHIRPRGFRDQVTQTNKGDNKHQKIINFVPLEAARTLAAGMMAGITSPSRPWFRLTLEGDVSLVEMPEVKDWLGKCEKVLREDLAKSNIYKALHLIYADLGPFATAAMLIEEDQEDGARAYVFPVGSYCLATSPRGDVDTLFRDVSMTVLQLVKLFGINRCSLGTQNLYRARQYDQRVAVVHAIFPNEDFKEGSLGPSGKKWLSCWWEANSSGEDGFLRQSGYEERPIMAPRWEVTGEDAYGFGPGFAAIGDCKALQLLEKRSAQAADKVVMPAMQAPSASQHGMLSLVPGGVSFVDSLGEGRGLRPAYEVNPNAIQIFEMKIERHEQRIRKAFYADLWLSITQTTGQMTAREVDERREEKLLQLGTVLEALNDELLDPIIDRFFAIALRQGRLPPPPEALQGKTTKTEYISIMAQAQKLLQTTGLERIATYVGNLAALKPEVLDKLDMDQLVDELADALGVPPVIIRADEAVEALRAARAQAAQKQQLMEQGAQAATTAQTLSATSMEDGNALTEMLRGAGVR